MVFFIADAVTIFSFVMRISGAPLHSATGEIPTNIGSRLQSIMDGVDESKLPNKFRDIAIMCDIYRKLNGLDIDGNMLQSSNSYSIEEPDISESNLAGNSNEMLNEMRPDTHETGFGLGMEHTQDNFELIASREKRVRRREPASILEGICLTDVCLQVLKEYLQWRREHGYPFSTGVSRLGG